MRKEEQIAQCAIRHYEDKLHRTKGKPKDTEWTVYAAIVVEDCHLSEFWVVSCATGTKCSSFVPSNDDTKITAETAILRDCHGEALARRGFVRALWKEIKNHGNTNKSDAISKSSYHYSGENRLLEPISCTGNMPSGLPILKFRLRSNLKIHMYISDSPCGDASIYPVIDAVEEGVNEGGPSKRRKRSELKFTGAKLIVSEETGVQASECGGDHLLLSPSMNTKSQSTSIEEGTDGISPSTHLAREDKQLLGKLRSKSGRSNLPADMRSSCMSCSDKLVRWNILGLQGACLTTIIDNPIRMCSIVVSRDQRAFSAQAQEEALRRATQSRIISTFETLCSQGKKPTKRVMLFFEAFQAPSVHVVPLSFPRGKSTMEYQKSQSAKSIHESGKRDCDKKRTRASSNPNIKKLCSPCGVSLNWDVTIPLDRAEQIVGARGLCQGKKPRTSEDYLRLASRLSRRSLRILAESTLKRSNSDSSNIQHEHTTYQEWKACVRGDTPYRVVRSMIFTDGPLAGWLTS